ncbi:hypothetical protein HaLaN_26034 [Haematococcus lacustris]|uniref:Uncharacterized protein n=1 Tax=Haematococcus lacustris TaxID=44745 RepID=A0A6A0A596_HAELA|nr:hypothetical protein HaLaN_26034 [Haematococcus lacustris]
MTWLAAQNVAISAVPSMPKLLGFAEGQSQAIAPAVKHSRAMRGWAIGCGYPHLARCSPVQFRALAAMASCNAPNA